MTEIRLALPIIPADPNKSPYLDLKIGKLDGTPQAGEKIEIGKGLLSDLNFTYFSVVVISCHQGYCLVISESSRILKKAMEIYRSAHPGDYKLLNPVEYNSLYSLSEEI